MENEDPRIPAFTEKTPGWECEGAEPRDEFKTEGFKAGYRPPAGYFNWFWTSVSRCVAELQSRLLGYAKANESDKTSLRTQLTDHAKDNENDKAKMQTQLTAKAEQSSLTAHTGLKTNPHVVTKAQVGLSAVTNVAQMPLSYWNWAAQTGQPIYVWGGNAANTYRAWNPSNFSVKYATNANHAATAGITDRVSATFLIGTNMKISAASNETYFMSSGKYLMRNLANSVYNSVVAWAFEAASTAEAKSEICKMESDFGKGLLAAVPVSYIQKQPEKPKARMATTEEKNTEEPEKQVGFTAEQLAEVFPEAVVYNESTNKPERVNLYALIAGTVALCQNQQKEIDALKAAVAGM